MCKFILRNTSKIPKYDVTKLDANDFVIPFEWGSQADSVFQQNHIYEQISMKDEICKYETAKYLDIFSIRIYQIFAL